MGYGIAAGVFWALETVLIGAALRCAPFLSSDQAILLAPFVSTFLHDFCSALWISIFNLIKGEWKNSFAALKNPDGRIAALAALIGGPVGMTGYVLAVNNLGASLGAVASAVYPAIGSVLAYFVLKERMQWYRWIFLIVTMAGVYGLSYSPGAQSGNYIFGVIGALMCSFGWGTEAVILAKCMKSQNITQTNILQIRQTTSALAYAAVILPVVKGWSFTLDLIKSDYITVLPLVAAAALCATISYLFYYRSISKIGASKSMALNITYAAWAMVFNLIIFKDKSMLNPLSVIFTVVVIISGIMAAADFKELIKKRS